MKTKTKKALQNITLLIFVIALSISVFEVTLRIFKVSSSYDYPKGMYQKDEILGYSMTPNFEGELIKPEFTTKIHTNSQGLRDKEYGKKEKDEFRILALGDSFTWGGYGTSLEETYVKILENKLSEKYNYNIKVINAGVPGYNNKQSYLFLKEKGMNYNPDMVLLSFFLNDFSENSINLQEIIIKEGIKVSDKNQKGILFKLRSFLLLKLNSYRLLERSMANIFSPLIKKIINKNSRSNQNLVDIFLKEPKEKTQKNVELTLNILDELYNFIEKKNISLVIFLVPEKHQIDKRLQEEFLKRNNLSPEEIIIDQPQRIIKDWASNKNVQIIDPLPRFKELNQNNDFFWELNPHFNKKGNLEAANVIAKEIKLDISSN